MKWLVSQDEFEQLISVVRELYPEASLQTIKQINYYYDSDSLMLFKQGITLRVRVIEGKIALERKENLTCVGGVRTAKEMNRELDELPESVDGYELLGILQTTRTRFTLPDDTNIDFDISRYLGIADYEVEIEIGKAIPRALITKLPKCGAIGKYERFINQLRGGVQ